MKCIKHAETGEIIRVDDIIANRMVSSVGKQKYNYVSKSEWKAATRPKTTVNIMTEKIKEAVDEIVVEKLIKETKKQKSK